MTALADVILAVAEQVGAAAPELNRLDAAAGDGDLGMTMEIAARALAAALPDHAGAAPADVLRAAGTTMAREAPSTAGTLVATGLLRAAPAVTGEAGAGPAAAQLAAGLGAAQAGIAERGKSEPGDRTMLDALAPAADAAAASAAAGGSLSDTLQAAAVAADAGATATRDMTARHGRAGWLAHRAAGHEDGGARLVAIVLAAAVRAVDGEATPAG